MPTGLVSHPQSCLVHFVARRLLGAAVLGKCQRTQPLVPIPCRGQRHLASPANAAQVGPPKPMVHDLPPPTSRLLPQPQLKTTPDLRKRQRSAQNRFAKATRATIRMSCRLQPQPYSQTNKRVPTPTPTQRHRHGSSQIMSRPRPSSSHPPAFTGTGPPAQSDVEGCHVVARESDHVMLTCFAVCVSSTVTGAHRSRPGNKQCACLDV